MSYSSTASHSIQIYPVFPMALKRDQQPLSQIADEVYNHLWQNSTFGKKEKKENRKSSYFTTLQTIARNLHYHLAVVHQAVNELIHTKRLELQDGYLILVKQGGV